MEPKHFQDWTLTPREAIALQRRLGEEEPLGAAPALEAVRTIVGVDVAYLRHTGKAYAAAIAFSYPDLERIKEATAVCATSYPYVPGLLSFREIPALMLALEQIAITPDVMLADGQGYAHMRRFGLARHLGWLYDVPSVGCAKTRLCGEFDMPAADAGAYSDLMDRGEKIGEVLRTRANVKPMFISPGHRMDFETARALTLSCCKGRRMPEPTRLAHQLTARLIK